MKFLSLITFILAVYGTAESSPAVVVNMNDFVDSLFADLEENASELGLANQKLPEVKADLDLVGGEVSLANGVISGLELMSRTNDISVEVTGDSAEATGNNIAFKNPIEIHYDAIVSLLLLKVNGSIDVEVNGLSAKMWGIVTLNDSETFSVEMEGCTLSSVSIDVNLDGLDLASDVLEPVTTAVTDLVTAQLNDVVAVTITDTIKAYLKGKIYNIPS